MNNPFQRVIHIQLSDDVVVEPGAEIAIEIGVGNPPDAAHSQIAIWVNAKKVPAATGFDFREKV